MKTLFKSISVVFAVLILTLTAQSQSLIYGTAAPAYYPKYGWLPNQDNTYRALDLGYQFYNAGTISGNAITVSGIFGKYYKNNILVTNVGANFTVFGQNMSSYAKFDNEFKFTFISSSAGASSIVFANVGTTTGFTTSTTTPLSTTAAGKTGAVWFIFNGTNFIETRRFNY